MSQDLNCNNLHGVVVSVPVANVPGYLAGQRTFSDGQDLNRVMPGKPNGSTSQVYAYNLIDRIVSKFTHLIDLHTASKGRANSLYVRANMNDPRTRRMAKLQNPQVADSIKKTQQLYLHLLTIVSKYFFFPSIKILTKTLDHCS